MSVSLLWKPTNPNKSNHFGSGSALYRALENAFGDFPISLKNTVEHISKLEGIKACDFKDVQCLINGVLEHESIEVGTEW